MDKKYLSKIIVQAIKEDKVSQDITTNTLVPRQHMSKATIVARENAVVCGINVAKAVFKKIHSGTQFQARAKDGQSIKKGTVIATVHGKTHALLKAERLALNFVSYLSAIATQTRAYVRAIKPYKAKIMDTRKTTPTLRRLEKYAVQCGGGTNHRFDLNQFVMLKDNHRISLKQALPIDDAIKKLRKKTSKIIEVEVDNLNQFKTALNAKPNIILLDNMTPSQIKKAVIIVKRLAPKNRPLLEASGGITLKNVRSFAQTGVDRISIGALTQSRKGINFSLDIK